MALLQLHAAVLALLALAASASTPLQPRRLRVNGLDAPLAVLAAPPAAVTFSWTLDVAAPPGARALAQASFRLQISLLALNFSGALVCDAMQASADPATASACAAPLAAPALAGAQLLWRVCAEADAAPPAACADADAAAAAPPAWSTAERFGLALSAAQWAAAGGFVAAPPSAQPGGLSRPVRMRAAAAAPPAPIALALLYIATPAYYEAHSGGARVDAPRASAVTTHTLFSRRIFYDAFDVTGAFGPAGAAFGLRVGGGPWAAAKFAAINGATGLPVRAAIAFTDAATGAVRLAPALAWRAAPDSVTATDWYGGESVDGRLEAPLAGWDTLAFDDSAWAAAVANSDGVAGAVLEPQAQPHVQLVGGAPLRPASVRALPAANTFVASFAQNFAGFVELDIPAAGAAGAVVELYAGERLFANGSVWNQLAYGSNMTLKWTLAGTAPLETARLTFMFWGSQHVEITGWPASATAPTVDSMRGFATSTLRRVADMEFDGVRPSSAIAAAYARAPAREREEEGGGESTSLMLNASILAGVLHAAVSSQLDNYQSLPSDCPNREASPSKQPWSLPPQSLWRLVSSAGCHLARACVRPLIPSAERPPSAARRDAQFDRAVYTPNTKEACATGAFMLMLQRAAALAPVAGHPEQAARFHALFDAAAAPYNAYYARNLTNGTYGDGVEQTLAVLPLSLGIVPAEHLATVQSWLINDIETTRALHLTTGATGTRFFFEVLSAMGRTDLAAAIAAQSTFPSHGFWVTQGATTCWENWSGESGPDHPPPPTRNHIFLCSHVGWLFDTLLGLSRPPEALGASAFASVAMAPPLIDSLPSMAGAVESVRGRFALGWAWQGAPMASLFALNASLPPTSRGSISVPVVGLANPTVAELGATVFANGAFVPGVAGIAGAVRNGSYVVVDVGSGDYSFTTSSAAAAPTLVSVCASAGAADSGASPAFVLACLASGARLARIVREGIVGSAAVDAGFADVRGGAARVPGAVRHRFLLMHTLERLCLGGRGATRCAPSWGELEAEARPAGAALAAARHEAGASVCVVAACE